MPGVVGRFVGIPTGISFFVVGTFGTISLTCVFQINTAELKDSEIDSSIAQFPGHVLAQITLRPKRIFSNSLVSLDNIRTPHHTDF